MNPPEISVLLRGGLLPLLTTSHVAAAREVGAAVWNGGVEVVEVALRTAQAMEVLTYLSDSPLIVGAGTVVTAEQVDEAVDAGARFVVSPGLSPGVIDRCNRRGVACLPGVATASELMEAVALGVSCVKFFPAAQLGATSGVAALGAAFPDVRFVPTGGIGPDNAPDYLSLPQVCAVGSSWPLAPQLVAERDLDEITRRCRAMTDAVSSHPSLTGADDGTAAVPRG